ncbi:MAG: DNA mismatch repair protein MutS, partial [Winogradskyella sp.]|nr:DNA mismatch repair protein MutS [Winogradskyella sp.]
MQQQESFYKVQLELHRVASKRIFKQMSLLSILRLFVFVATGFGIYLSFHNAQLATFIGVAGIAFFLFLLSHYTNLKTERDLHKRLALINEDELKIASGDFHNRPDGSEFQNPKHFYSLDIDLFGKGSFFQFINRTTIKEGTEKLTKYLLANDVLDIETRQEAIKELGALPIWRQNYSGVAQGVAVQNSAISIIKWLKGYQSFLSSFHYWFTMVYSLISIVILVLGITEVVSIVFTAYRLLLWLIIGLGITAIYL